MKYGTMSYLSVNEKVLMIKKKVRKDDPNSGLYALPGGKLEDFEKGLSHPFGRLKSAVRETIDETGLRLIYPRLRGIILFDNSERVFDNWPNPDDYLVYIFASRNYAGRLKDETDEGTPVWIDEKFINKVKKNVGDEKMYEWLKIQRYFVGVIRHKGRELDKEGTFADHF
ncbi:MAG: NUDIX domain-containing protein [Nanoarchaeota archaeon]|mgnify:CR=1 FL=1